MRSDDARLRRSVGERQTPDYSNDFREVSSWGSPLCEIVLNFRWNSPDGTGLGGFREIYSETLGYKRRRFKLSWRVHRSASRGLMVGSRRLPWHLKQTDLETFRYTSCQWSFILWRPSSFCDQESIQLSHRSHRIFSDESCSRYRLNLG